MTESAEQLEREAFEAAFKGLDDSGWGIYSLPGIWAWKGWQAARRHPHAAPDGWRTVMEDLAEELEEQVCHRYQGYPPNDRRFVRDMLSVKEAREFLKAHKDKP